MIGVYAKSVKYCGDRSITKGKVFEAIRDHVFAQKQEKTNYLGVCFFGIWSYRRKGKIMCRAVQVPVKTCNEFESDEFSCVWETGHTIDEIMTVDKEKRKFKHVPCKGDHTEERAISFLLDQQTQKSLWINFLKQTKQRTKVPEKRVLDCIGFHFFSKLDACDQCLRKLVDFQSKGMDFCPPRMPSDSHGPYQPYEVDTLCDRVPFVITFASSQLYHPELLNYKDLRDNSVHSASLLFTPHPYLLRLSGKRGKRDHSPHGYRVELVIEHQDSVHLDEKEEFDFVVLMVNDGTPVKIN